MTRNNAKDAEAFRQDLLNIAKTTLSSKILTGDKEKFAKIAVDAVLRLKGSTNLEHIQARAPESQQRCPHARSGPCRRQAAAPGPAQALQVAAAAREPYFRPGAFRPPHSPSRRQRASRALCTPVLRSPDHSPAIRQR